MAIVADASGNFPANVGGADTPTAFGHIVYSANNVTAITSAPFYWRGGPGVLSAKATWGGGSAKVQRKMVDGTWVDVKDATLSADGTVPFTVGPCWLRFVTATATGVYADVASLAETNQ